MGRRREKKSERRNTQGAEALADASYEHGTCTLEIRYLAVMVSPILTVFGLLAIGLFLLVRSYVLRPMRARK